MILKSTKKFKWIALLALLTINFTGLAQLNKQYFYNLARNQIYQNQFTQSIQTLNTLIKVDSTIADAWFLRGLAKYNLNDFHGALADLTKAINHNPVFSQAYLYRGVVYNRFSRYNQALADFEIAIDLRPNSAEGYYSRGINYLLTQQLDKAINDFSRVINYQPKNVDAWINRGTAYLYAGDSLAALSDYSHAVDLNPFYSESYSRRGRLHFELKEFNSSLDDFDKAIEIDTTTSINYFLRALTYNSLKEINQALSDLNRAIELTPNNALSIYNRALIHWKQGNNKDALIDFDRVVDLNPENVLVYYNRGVLFYESENFTEAIGDFTTAIELFPDFANAYLGRASAYARVGKYYDSEMDKTFAQSIAERFGNNNGQALTDTSKKFNDLIAFSSDFTTRTSIPLIDEFDTKPVDILPFIKVIAVPDDKLITSNQLFQPIDTLNNLLRSNKIGLTFSSKKSTIDFDSININNTFLLAFIDGLNWSSQSKYNQAVNAFEKSLKYEPNNNLVLINLAVEKAEMVSFIASFEKEVGAVTLNDISKRNKKEYTTSGIQLESFGESVEIFNAVNETLPNHYVVLYNLGNVYALSGDIESAVNYYTQAIDKNPNAAEAWYNRGLIHFMQNDKVNGCIDMGKAGEQGVKQAYLLIHRFCRR